MTNVLSRCCNEATAFVLPASWYAGGTGRRGPDRSDGRDFGIIRQDWRQDFDRYRDDGPAAPRDQSRRPVYCAERLPQWVGMGRASGRRRTPCVPGAVQRPRGRADGIGRARQLPQEGEPRARQATLQGVHLMLHWHEIALRLGAAAVIGSVIGAYLEWRGKPTGIRTLGLVALASAVAVLAVAKDPDADASRVIQGVITGIGFLGTGVILHRGAGQMVHGLSTAATIWITASLGVLCGLAAWPLLAVALVLTVFLLIAGAVIEKWLQGHRLVSDEQSTSQ